jgi:hypothetical protein
LRIATPGGSSPSVAAKSGGAPTKATVCSGLIPSFFASGVPEYPAKAPPYAVPVIDDGPAIHYLAVPLGTPVYASDETQVGTVDQVVDNYREHILDGFVIRTAGGDLRFVDAPEVGRTAERGVTLTISPAEVEELPPPDPGAGTFSANVRPGRLGRLLGRSWKRD